MNIYIVRHGETKSNKEGRLQGWTDDTLNDAGVFLAELTGRALSDVKFDVAYASSLKRAYATAEIILSESGNACDITVDDRIKEIHMGELEGKKFRPGESEIDENLIKAFFKNPIALGTFPGGESILDVMKRTQEFLKEISKLSYDNVLVSTHGCALRCMLNFLYEDKNDFWHGHVPYNCCINIVEVTDGEMRLTADDLILYDKEYCVDRFGMK